MKRIPLKSAESRNQLRETVTLAPGGLLRACKTSGETILKVYTTCLESGERKIRMNSDRDVLVLFSTDNPAIEYGNPTAISPDTCITSPVNMVSGVKSLAKPIYVMYGYSYNKERWLLS
jgi:hypothetical protein